MVSVPIFRILFSAFSRLLIRNLVLGWPSGCPYGLPGATFYLAISILYSSGCSAGCYLAGTTSRACLWSAMRSSASSSPTLKRKNPSPMSSG